MHNHWKQQDAVKGVRLSHHKRQFSLVMVGILCVVMFVAAYFVVPSVWSVTYDVTAQNDQLSGTVTSTTKYTLAPPVASNDEPLLQYHKTPKPLKAIYMTQCVVGTPDFRASLVRLIEETELNAVVIDIKDFSGGIAFPTDNPILKAGISTRCGARDMKAFVALLHEKGIYVIGRITVFQDPLYTKTYPDQAVQSRGGGVWHDYKGLAFVDVSAKPYWDYIVALSRESHKLGFDELNYDYIRFPSDGPMGEAVYTWTKDQTKAEALEHFYVYLTDHVRDMTVYQQGTPVPVLSADLFGMTTTNTDDLNIGQVLERALPYFDYIAPMVYPSHYPKGFHGWNNPNTVPYELIKYVLSSAVKRTEAPETAIQTLSSEKIYRAATTTGTSTPVKVFTGMYSKESYDRHKIRPWLQDFDYGGNYDVPEVKAQIQATYDAGLDSWMLWAPSNRYTEGALGPGP